VPIRSPDAIRPWQHVLDPLSGYLLLTERLWERGMEYAEAWNFGPDEADARSVRWIADRIVELWGDGASWRLDQEVHPPEATYLRLDCTKARERLGWRPALHLGQALAWLVDWYRARHEGDDMRRLTLDSIARYEALPGA
jgi:CDP-glucose 4,6-dehydratase